MTRSLLAPEDLRTAGWLDAVRDTELGSGISVDLWFECRDGEDWWTHVCRIRDGRAIDWRPEEAGRPCIAHDLSVMTDAVERRCGTLDQRWRFAHRPRSEDRALPPVDLIGIEVDVTPLRLPADLDLSWTTVCLLPHGPEVAYVSELRSGTTIRHRWPEPDEPASNTVLTYPLVDHLKLRSGGDVMAAFDHGGAVGDIDELFFLAGLLDSAACRSALELADASVWRVHDHVRLFGALCAGEGAA